MGSFSNPGPPSGKGVLTVPPEKRQRSQEKLSGTFRFPTTTGSSLPPLSISEGAETSAKRLLKSASPIGEGVCKDFTYKIEKNCQYYTAESGDFGWSVKGVPKPLVTTPLPRYPIHGQVFI